MFNKDCCIIKHLHLCSPPFAAARNTCVSLSEVQRQIAWALQSGTIVTLIDACLVRSDSIQMPRLFQSVSVAIVPAGFPTFYRPFQKAFACTFVVCLDGLPNVTSLFSLYLFQTRVVFISSLLAPPDPAKLRGRLWMLHCETHGSQLLYWILSGSTLMGWTSMRLCGRCRRGLVVFHVVVKLLWCEIL